MDCSIIIVNYNVEYFLYQCLDSVTRATKELDAEIIVIDNASSDESISMIETHFPSVIIIQNKKNVGFGKANNQGIARAKGEFCLLLNPDTMVQEDTIVKCIDYLRKEKINTGLGIKMIDGSGQFLPESKRSFPSPGVAFYKLFGLAKLFPRNKRFGQYHLTYLSANENQEVEVLSGAFLMAKTSVLQEKQGFDEDFFMYGEDIDLSYRLIAKEEKNHYFAASKIIHYKGESTKSGSLNYVKNFYQAMIIFARKHLSGNNARLFIFIINLAIWARAALTLFTSSVRRIGLPVVDFLLSFAAMLAVNYFWGIYRFREPFPVESLYVNLPIYALVFAICMYFSGAYDKPYSFFKIMRGAIFGVIFTAFIYAFFPEDYRFSRLFILFSGIAVGIVYTFVRLVAGFLQSGKLFLYQQKQLRILYVGNQSEEKVSLHPLLQRNDITFLGIVSEQENAWRVGQLSELNQLVNVLKPSDIIFDTKSLSYQYIVDQFEQINTKAKLHTAIDHNNVILSSYDKRSGGEIYFQEKQYQIEHAGQRRNKRLFDVITSIAMLLFFPFFIWRTNYRNRILPNSLPILFGKKTFVGYQNDYLPKLKQHVISVASGEIKNQEIRNKIEENYAKYYTVYRDFDSLINQL